MHGFTVDKQQLRKITNYSIVSDTVNYLEFEFTFSADWDGVKKYAQFTHGESTHEVEIVDGVISASSEVALSPGEWGIKVIGVLKDGPATVKRVTTNAVALFVLDSGLTDGEPFPAVGGSIGEQIVASEEDRVAAESSRVAAELVRSDAESSRALAEQARDSAEELRESAEIEREQTMSTGHNAFNGLQGGSAAERYHMTQAQNAALHAHSNKTALDAVSGTNTGDQDVSGAISTHNSNAAAHAILARKTETMRLLISRTIGAGENVSAITWTQDDAGNALALIDAEIRIRTFTNSLANGANGLVTLQINNISAGYYSTFSTSSASFVYAARFRNVFGDAITSIEKCGNGHRMNMFAYGHDAVAAQTTIAAYQGGTFASSSVTKIYLSLTGLTYFPDGTTIEIYGRKA